MDSNYPTGKVAPRQCLESMARHEDLFKFFGALYNPLIPTTIIGREQANAYYNTIDQGTLISDCVNEISILEKRFKSKKTIRITLPTLPNPTYVTAYVLDINVPLVIGNDVVKSLRLEYRILHNDIYSRYHGISLPFAIYDNKAHIIWPTPFLYDPILPTEVEKDQYKPAKAPVCYNGR